MDASALYLKLAEQWHGAARQTTNDELRACYAGRAAQYLELAARERRQMESKAPSWKRGV